MSSVKKMYVTFEKNAQISLYIVYLYKVILVKKKWTLSPWICPYLSCRHETKHTVKFGNTVILELNPSKSGKAVTQDQTYSLEFGFAEALTSRNWGLSFQKGLLQETSVIVWKNPRWISPLWIYSWKWNGIRQRYLFINISSEGHYLSGILFSLLPVPPPLDRRH